MKSRYLMTALAVLFLPAPAVSADISAPIRKAVPPQAYNWSGFYIGINGGWAGSGDSTSIAGGDPIANIVMATGIVPSSLKTEANGGFGGGQIGWNWQFGSGLFGLEADIQFGSIDGSDGQTISVAPLGIPVSLTTNATTELEWFGTVRGRLGWLPTDYLLIYVTGGLAYGKTTWDGSITLNAPAPIGAVAAGSYSDTKFGWTIGGGAEVALGNNFTLKAEYLYADLGIADIPLATTVLAIPVSFSAHQDFTYHIARVGLNYKF